MATYKDYREAMQKIADVRNALAVLQWDQEVFLPSKGNGFRGRQMATLSEQVHLLSTDEKLGTMIGELLGQNDLAGNERKNVLLTAEDYAKQKKYTSAFVRELSETSSRAFHRWVEARRQNDFSVFEDDLDQLIHLKREEAGILGYQEHPYNALLNEYEKGCTVARLDTLFHELRPKLKDLLDRILGQPQVDDSFLHRFYPKQEQWEFGLSLISQLGFDFEAGRQDLSEHPFTTSFNVHDVRITTRIDEQNFSHMTWSCIHETGHALYEQGLPESEYGLPSGEFASLGIHESQSRLWENNIGRGLPFWTCQYPALAGRFPDALGDISLEKFYRGINKVEPTLVRTEADEITYHFHILIRYELEKALLTGDLAAHDIPAYWNEQYRNYLGVVVKEDKTGCLQDVHWSHGSLGYFPTYSLGSLYAAQWYARVRQETPDFEKRISGGNNRFLIQWLRDNIYRHGRLMTSEELCVQATGKPLSIQHFMDYALDKYQNIYDL